MHSLKDNTMPSYRLLTTYRTPYGLKTESTRCKDFAKAVSFLSKRMYRVVTATFYDNQGYDHIVAFNGSYRGHEHGHLIKRK